MKLNFIPQLQFEPATAATIIAGAASAIGSGANAYAQGKMNKKTREYNKWAMKQQREWALSDWERQNQYNSPAQQMQRLREAGLNPHLIYAGGQPTNTASAVDSTNINAWNPQAPDIGAIMTSPVNAYLETRVQNAQVKKIDAETLKALADVDTKNFDLSQKQRLADTQASIMQEILTGHKINNELNKDENIRRNLQTSTNLNEAATRMRKMVTEMDLNEMMNRKGNEEIKNIRQMRKKVDAEIENLKKSGFLLDFEKKLNDSGLTKNDGLFARLVQEVLTGAGLSTEMLSERLKNWLDKDNKINNEKKSSFIYWFNKAYPNNPYNKNPFKPDRKKLGY